MHAKVSSDARVTLGRVLRLDRQLRDPQKARSAAIARWVLHGFMLVLMLVCIGVGVAEFWAPAEQEESDAPWLLAFHFVSLIGLSIAFEVGMWWTKSYELQLLPFGIRHSAWGYTTELIEPEIVGGRWLRWTQQITLRAGKKRISIALTNFTDRRDRAAIIAHCSQFLSPAQVAEFGSEWTRVYYAIVTPPKENPLRMLILTTGCCVLGCASLTVLIESILWIYPDAVNETGGSLRTVYQAFPWITAGLIFPFVLMSDRVRREQRKLQKA